MEDMQAVITGSSKLESLQAKSIAHFIEVCQRCSVSSTACADECLDEPDISVLRRCIRLNQDCADICTLVARVLSRRGEPDVSTLRVLLEACINITTNTAAEAQKHASQLEYCQLAAEMCLTCGRECEGAMSLLCDLPSA